MTRSKKGSSGGNAKGGRKKETAVGTKEPKAGKIVAKAPKDGPIHPSYDLKKGGEEIPANRIQFMPREKPQVGYFDVFIDGFKVTRGKVRGGFFDESVRTGATMAGFLVKGGGDGARFAIFANGKIGKWSGGLPKIFKDPGTGDVRLKVGKEERVVSMKVV